MVLDEILPDREMLLAIGAGGRGQILETGPETQFFVRGALEERIGIASLARDPGAFSQPRQGDTIKALSGLRGQGIVYHSETDFIDMGRTP